MSNKLTLLSVHAPVWGGGGPGDHHGGGLGGHVAPVAGGGGGGDTISGHQAIVCGGQVIDIDHSHHVVPGVEAGSLGLLSLGLGGHLDRLGEGGGGLLTLDEHGLDLPLGGGGGDHEAEPQWEDDAEGDGGGGQPPGHPDLGMQTGDPVRPAPEERMTLITYVKLSTNVGKGFRIVESSSSSLISVVMAKTIIQCRTLLMLCDKFDCNWLHKTHDTGFISWIWHSNITAQATWSQQSYRVTKGSRAHSWGNKEESQG